MRKLVVRIVPRKGSLIQTVVSHQPIRFSLFQHFKCEPCFKGLVSIYESVG